MALIDPRKMVPLTSQDPTVGAADPTLRRQAPPIPPAPFGAAPRAQAPMMPRLPSLPGDPSLMQPMPMPNAPPGVQIPGAPMAAQPAAPMGDSALRDAVRAKIRTLQLPPGGVA